MIKRKILYVASNSGFCKCTHYGGIETTGLRGLRVLKEVIMSPARAFSEIHEGGKDFLLWGLLFVALPKVVAGLIHMDVSYLKTAPLIVAEWLIATTLLFFASRVLGGKANFLGLLSAVGYAWFPLTFLPVLGYLALSSIPEEALTILQNTPEDQISQQQIVYVINHVFTPVTIVLSLIMLALMLWSLALSVLAVRESNGFSTWRAFCITISVVLIDRFVISRIVGDYGMM